MACRRSERNAYTEERNRMNPHAVREAATRLLDAYEARKPVPRLTDSQPDLTVDDAYLIQQEQVRRWTSDGQVVRGYRVSAVPVGAGGRQPAFGRLTAARFHPEHQPVTLADLIQPRIESGIAFVLGRRLEGPAVTAADAVRAVEFVLPSLEIADSRVEDGLASLVDAVADNAGAGEVILGCTPRLLAAADLRLAGCVLYRNGEVAQTGAGGVVLGSPLNALVWLANAAARLGLALEPGQVVVAGSMTPAVAAAPGDNVVLSVAGTGTVTAVLAA